MNFALTPYSVWGNSCCLVYLRYCLVYLQETGKNHDWVRWYWSFGHLEPEFGQALAFSFHAHGVSTRGFIVVPETQPWRMLRVTDSDFFKCLGKLFHEIPPQKLVFDLQTLQTSRKFMEIRWVKHLHPFCLCWIARWHQLNNLSSCPALGWASHRYGWMANVGCHWSHRYSVNILKSMLCQVMTTCDSWYLKICRG